MKTTKNRFLGLLQRFCEMKEQVTIISMGCMPAVGVIQEVNEDYIWCSCEIAEGVFTQVYIPLALVAGIESK